MTDMDELGEPQGMSLCKSCGLCCTGHLFIWTKLRSAELDAIRTLGLKVFREPGRRGFSQPCPLWRGQCTIYVSPHYPRFCHTYKCKLLKEVLDEITPLPHALTVVEQAKDMINELDALLPPSPDTTFRERLVAQIGKFNKSDKQGSTEKEFQRKARELLAFYKTQFGVSDVMDKVE